jgi:NADPH2:quinone reductase
MSDLGRYREGAAATIAHLQAGLKVEVGTELPLADAARAHDLLESGATVGSVLLRPRG